MQPSPITAAATTKKVGVRRISCPDNHLVTLLLVQINRFTQNSSQHGLESQCVGHHHDNYTRLITALHIPHLSRHMGGCCVCACTQVRAVAV